MQALGELNFRDVGGIPVEGGFLRRGAILRSEGPASFEEAHRAELVALGVRFVCDLRTEAERNAHPNAWARGARLFNADVAADLRDHSNSGWDMLQANPNAEGARQVMLANYRRKPEAIKPFLAEVVDALVAGETPMLIHCTAGKDRTGVLVAFLLRMLDASHAQILHDYLLSDRFHRRPGSGDAVARRLAGAFGFAPDEAVLAPILGVDPAYIDAAFAAIDEGWGSFDAYLADAGVGRAKQAALREALVEPAAGTAGRGRAS